MLRIREIKLKYDIDSATNLKLSILKKLKLPKNYNLNYKIVKKSIDARKKPDVYYVYEVLCELDKNLEEKTGKLNISYKTTYNSTAFNAEIRLNDNNFYEVEKHEKNDLYGLFLPIEDGIKFIEDICLEPSKGTSYIINNIKKESEHGEIKC